MELYANQAPLVVARIQLLLRRHGSATTPICVDPALLAAAAALIPVAQEDAAQEDAAPTPLIERGGMDIQFVPLPNHRLRLVLAGPRGCGKTILALRLGEHVQRFAGRLLGIDPGSRNGVEMWLYDLGHMSAQSFRELTEVEATAPWRDGDAANPVRQGGAE